MNTGVRTNRGFPKAPKENNLKYANINTCRNVKKHPTICEAHTLNSNRGNPRTQTYFGLEVLKAVFWDVAPRTSEKAWRIGGKQLLNLQDKRQK
jgi:hypothetical protein